MLDDSNDGQLELLGVIERQIDQYVALNNASRKARFVKYNSDPEIFWEIHCDDGGGFVVCLDKKEMSVCTFRQRNKRGSIMEKHFDNYIREIMGNGKSWIVRGGPQPS